MPEMEIKEIDDQGRIIIPKAWRSKHLKGNKVVMKLGEGIVEVVPYGDLDLTEWFDRIEVDVKSNLGDWHSVRREIRRF